MISRIIDLTLPVVPGLRGAARTSSRTIERDGWNAANWELYSHAGTHMDAPVHFAAGSGTIDQIPLSTCLGPAWVTDLRPVEPGALLEPRHLGSLEHRFTPGESLLLRTGWSAHANDPAHYRDRLPRVSEALARWCVERRVKLLGVEPPSVADVNNLPEVTLIHQILLGGGVTIVEGLANLEMLTQERVFFAALPLKLENGDGAPVRAFAIEGLAPGVSLF
jgi:kynurenine formamidase